MSEGDTERELGPDRVAELAAQGAELIDVRQQDEWDEGRLAGARRVEMNELSGAAATIPRDRAVVFYCRTGHRSGMAAQAFREAGYDAYNLAGGLVAWTESGRALEPEGGTVAGPRPG